MYLNMKYYENFCNCLRVIQQDINRKLKSANCWQRTSLKDDVALLTSSFSSSPAIVRNASILNLPKFVFICGVRVI